MSIWNKALLVLIGLAAVPFFFLAGRVLQTRKYWAELAQKFEKRIDQVQNENFRLAEGTTKDGQPTGEGIRQVQLHLFKLTVDRRRAWANCLAKVKTGAADGTAEVTVTTDAPHGIAAKTVVYAFDDAEVQQKGRYLGEFVITKATEKQITFVPTTRLNQREIESLRAANNRPWRLYEELPRDNREVFAALSDEQKREIFPAPIAEEYVKDGKPAVEVGPTDRIVDGKYVRPLHNFNVLLSAERDHRILLTDAIEAATRDLKLAQEALADARKQEEACKKDIAAIRVELKEAGRQREVVANYRKQLEKKLDDMQAWVAQLIETNQAMAGQLAKFQLDAAERIDQRTRAMARIGTGRP